MRKYSSSQENNELLEARCNQCGKALNVENGIAKEEIISTEHMFGYFSERDGEKHSFDLCEVCYNELINNFKIPATEQEVKELL